MTRSAHAFHVPINAQQPVPLALTTPAGRNAALSLMPNISTRSLLKVVNGHPESPGRLDIVVVHVIVVDGSLPLPKTLGNKSFH